MLKQKMKRDIKNNLSQFITIFLMVAIGVMAYSGIKAYMGEDIGTVFLAPSGISKKRRWIKSAHAVGKLVIDEGAGKAILAHRSLLPVGIKRIEGRFDEGDVVEIICNGDVVAKGIVSYDSDELLRIAGKRSSDICALLGRKGHDDAVLSGNIALL